MRGPTEVSWNEFSAALAKLFLHITRCTRALTDQDLEHLKNRLFTGKPPVMNPMVSWDQFTTVRFFVYLCSNLLFTSFAGKIVPYFNDIIRFVGFQFLDMVLSNSRHVVRRF